jgi:hypothetical protein
MDIQWILHIMETGVVGRVEGGEEEGEEKKERERR